MNKVIEHKENQRVVTFLNRDEVDFLDKLGKDALFTTGFKLSRAKLISWLVDFMKGLNINGEGIKSEEDLENRIKGILKQIGKIQAPPATPFVLTSFKQAEKKAFETKEAFHEKAD